MTSFLSKKALLFFGAAFLIRFIYILFAPEHLVWPDEISFHQIATRLLETGEYQAEIYRWNPVLPFFLAAIYQLFGVQFLYARIAGALIGAGAVLFFYLLVRRLHGEKIADWSTLIFACYPPHIYLAGVFIVANIFTFEIILSLFLLERFVRMRKEREGIYLGLCLGLLVLTRPFSLILLFVYLLFLLLKKVRLRSILLCYFFAFLLIAPWTYRNYTILNKIVPVSTGAGINLWRGNNELTYGDEGDRLLSPFNELWYERLRKLPKASQEEILQKYQQYDVSIERFDDAAKDQFYLKLGFQSMIEEPLLSIKHFFLKFQTLLHPYTVPDTNVPLSQFAFLILRIFYFCIAIGFLVYLLIARKRKEEIYYFLPIVSLVFGYSLLTACTRFRLPIDCFFIVLAVIGFFHVLKLKEKLN